MDLDGTCPDPKLSSKWKSFRDEVTSILKSFDSAKEWADVIKCLNKLHKVLEPEHKKYGSFNQVPDKLTLCKRLAQCLNPKSLPSGVHLKALEVYGLIFEKIGPRNLAIDLPLYSMGLFPLFQFAATSIRPKILDLYEKYYLACGGVALAACVDGLIASILYGLEEDNAAIYPSTLKLLDAIASSLDPEPALFWKALWKAIYVNGQVRVSGFNYIRARFPGVEPKSGAVSASVGQDYLLGNSPSLVWNAIIISIGDSNPLTRRAALDCVISFFRIHEEKPLTKRDKVLIMIHALRIVPLNELPSLRRLYNWIFGGEAPYDAQYFNQHAKPILVEALKALLRDNSDAKFDPFDILFFLIGGNSPQEGAYFSSLLPDIMWDVLCRVTKDTELLSQDDDDYHRIFNILPMHLVWNCMVGKVLDMYTLSNMKQHMEDMDILHKLAYFLPTPDVCNLKLDESHVNELPEGDDEDEEDLDSFSSDPAVAEDFSLSFSTVMRKTQREKNRGSTTYTTIYSAKTNNAEALLFVAQTTMFLIEKTCHNPIRTIEDKLLMVQSCLSFLAGLIEYGNVLMSEKEWRTDVVDYMHDFISSYTKCFSGLILNLITQTYSQEVQTSGGNPCEVLANACDIVLVLAKTRLKHPYYQEKGFPVDESSNRIRWHQALLGDIIENGPPNFVCRASQLAVDLVLPEPFLIHPSIRTQILDDLLSPIMERLWELMSTKFSPYHVVVVPQILAYYQVRKAPIKDYVTKQMTSADAICSLEDFVRLATFWNVMDDMKIEQQAFTSCMFLILDALRSERPFLKLLAGTWVERAILNMPRLVNPLLNRLIDKDSQSVLDFRRTAYVVQTLTALIETVPSSFVTTALHTAVTDTKQDTWLHVLPMSSDRLYSGLDLKCANYFELLVATLIRIAEEQLPKYDPGKNVNIKNVYMAHQNRFPVINLQGSNGAVTTWDLHNMDASITSFCENVLTEPYIMEPMSDEAVERNDLCVKSVYCLRLLLCHAFKVLRCNSMTSPMVYQVANSTLLLLNGSIPMNSSVLQHQLLSLLGTLLVYLNQDSSNSFHDHDHDSSRNTGGFGSPTKVARVGGGNAWEGNSKHGQALEFDIFTSSPILSYTLLSGLLHAGTQANPVASLESNFFALWVDSVSSIFPLTGNSASLLTTGLGYAYCHMLKQATSWCLGSCAASKAKLCLTGFKQMLWSVFPSHTIRMCDMSNEMTKPYTPPGLLFQALFPRPDIISEGQALNDSILGHMTFNNDQCMGDIYPPRYTVKIAPAQDNACKYMMQLLMTVTSLAVELNEKLMPFNNRLSSRSPTLERAFSSSVLTSKPSEVLPCEKEPYIDPEYLSNLEMLWSEVDEGFLNILNPMMKHRPLQTLRSIIGLLSKSYTSPEVLFEKGAGLEKIIIGYLDSGTSTVDSIVKNLGETLLVATNLVKLRAFVPNTAVLCPELVIVFFLKELIRWCGPSEGLPSCLNMLYSLCNAREIHTVSMFMPAVCLSLFLEFLQKCARTETIANSAILEDAAWKRKIFDLVYFKLIDQGLRLSIAAESPPTCVPETALSNDVSAVAISYLTLVLRGVHEAGLLKALDRDEKDRVSPILAGLLTSVIGPVLKLKDSARKRCCLKIRACVDFIQMALQSFPYLLRRDAVKKEMWEYLHDPNFFMADRLTLLHWKSIIYMVMLSDVSTHYQDMLTRIQASQGGIFTAMDTIARDRAALLRRLSFILLAAQPDSPQLLSAIIERFVDALRLNHSLPTRQTLVCFRSLILKVPPQNLASHWPTILDELLRIVNKGSTQNKEVMLEALKSIDLIMVVQPQQFQIFKWIFINESADDDPTQPRTRPRAGSSMTDHSPFQSLISSYGKSSKTDTEEPSSPVCFTSAYEAVTGNSIFNSVPLLCIPERHYSEITAVEDVANVLINESPLEKKMKYQARPAFPTPTAGQWFDDTSLAIPSNANITDVKHIEWLLLTDLCEFPLAPSTGQPCPNGTPPRHPIQ